MSSALDSQRAFHRGTSAIFSLLTPQQLRQLADLQADPALAARVEELSQKANEGDLSESERSEYEAYIEADNLLGILQSEARVRLQVVESL